jgi:dTDP-D-glucose 4,6-dehydratase
MKRLFEEVTQNEWSLVVEEAAGFHGGNSLNRSLWQALYFLKSSPIGTTARIECKREYQSKKRHAAHVYADRLHIFVQTRYLDNYVYLRRVETRDRRGRKRDEALDSQGTEAIMQRES